jgi:hypothetical protein
MSSYDALVNMIHREVLRVLYRQTARTPCVVDSYDPTTAAVKVRLMPDSIDGDSPLVTGWLSLHPLQTGNGFGWHMPPNIGDHGWVEFHDDDREAGQFVVATFNDQFVPVPTVMAGEWFYQNKWGASVYFAQDGSITLTDATGSTIVMNGAGKVTVTDAAGSMVALDGAGGIVVAGKGGATVTLSDAGAMTATDKGGNTVTMDGVSKVAVKDAGGDSMTLSGGVITAAGKTGNKAVLDAQGNVQAVPSPSASPPAVVYLGGTGSEPGATYSAVMTAAEIPAMNVFARCG